MVSMHQTRLREINLNLLHALHALLEERHVTRAARRCFLTQSAMSRALNRLHDMLRDPLFVRTGRVYERTPRGDPITSRAVGQTSARRVVGFAGHFLTFMSFTSQSFITLSPCVAPSYSFCSFLGLMESGNYAYSLCSSRRISAARSPMMMQGAMVLPVVTRGMIEPSAMRRFSIP